MRRLHIPGATIFFTVGLAVPGSWLLIDEIDTLRFAVGRTRGQRPFEVLAWVVLPDRMHAVWCLPPDGCDYGQRWAAIKGCFSSELSRQGRMPRERRGVRVSRGEVGIWQKRFWEHHIRSERDLAAHLDLCRMAPVRARLVTRPQDWPFGTFRRDDLPRPETSAFG